MANLLVHSLNGGVDRFSQPVNVYVRRFTNTLVLGLPPACNLLLMLPLLADVISRNAALCVLRFVYECVVCVLWVQYVKVVLYAHGGRNYRNLSTRLEYIIKSIPKQSLWLVKWFKVLNIDDVLWYCASPFCAAPYSQFNSTSLCNVCFANADFMPPYRCWWSRRVYIASIL